MTTDTMKSTLGGDYAEVTMGQDDSAFTAVCLTLTDKHTGRKARCWLSCRIKPNGRAEASIDVLGADERTDSRKSAWLPWHDDLDGKDGVK